MRHNIECLACGQELAILPGEMSYQDADEMRRLTSAEERQGKQIAELHARVLELEAALADRNRLLEDLYVRSPHPEVTID